MSVCGVNAAAVARPIGGGSATSITAYFVGLCLGALALCAGFTWLGYTLTAQLPVSLATREAILVCLLGLLGITELLGGPGRLPHIAWAVPRSWAGSLRALPFRLAFGLIRGLAIFNHSPFASMHAWLLAVLLVPELISTMTLAVVLFVGLAVWSIVYAAIWIANSPRRSVVFENLTSRAIGSTPVVARLDAAALIVIATLIAGQART